MADLEYDLAHEATDSAADAVRPPDPARQAVRTGTPDYDGDYSYDLAHEVPKDDPDQASRRSSR
jgi:hypothetical protein